MADIEMAAGQAGDAQSHTQAGIGRRRLANIQRCDAWPRIARANPMITAVIMVCIGITIIVLIAESFTYIEWDQRGFKRSTATSWVSTEQVYNNGQHFWGIGYDAVILTAKWTRHSVRLSIASSNGQEFNIDIIFYWYIPSSNLRDLFKQFGLSMVDQVEIQATAAIKDEAPKIKIGDYLQKRAEVTDRLFRALDSRMDALGVDVRRNSFHMHAVHVPQRVRDSNLRAALQIQTNELRLNQQAVAEARAITKQLSDAIRSNTTLATASATAKSERIVTEAKAEAVRITTTPDAQGINNLFESMNVTDSTDKSDWFEYFRLTKLIDEIDFANRIDSNNG